MGTAFDVFIHGEVSHLKLLTDLYRFEEKKVHRYWHAPQFVRVDHVATHVEAYQNLL